MKTYFNLLTLKQKRKLFIIICILLIITGFILPKVLENNRPYIDDNILNMPFFNAVNFDNNTFGSVWKEQRINSMFLYRSLFMPDQYLNSLLPDLASTYEISNNSTRYSIHIKDGNFWSDGEPLTIDDVIFTIEAVLKDEDVADMFRTVLLYIVGASEFKSGEASSISGLSIDPSDSNILNIDIITPYKNFMIVLSQIVIVPEHILKDEDLTQLHNSDFWANPVVSGMYYLDEIVKNPETNDYYFKLLQNPSYNKEKSTIQEVRFHKNYLEKNLDYYPTNNIADMITYSNYTNYTKHDVPMFLYKYFIFNISGDDGNYNQAMDDTLFRKAIITALDREKLLSSVYLNNGEVINSGVPNYSASNNGFTYEYDIEKAKELLEESSYDISRPLVIGYTTDDELTSYFLSEVQKSLNNIGLVTKTIHVQTEEEIYIDRKYDLLYTTLTAFNHHTWYSEYNISRETHNKLISMTDELGELYDMLCTSETNTQEAEYYKILQELEQENLYKIPMFLLNQVVYTNDKKLDLPEDIKFGNSWYRYDIKIKDWAIKKISKKF